MKNFRVKGTHKCPNLEVPDVPVNDLPNLSLRKLGLRVGKYKPIPTNIQWRSLLTPIPTKDYIQHRQQDQGRAIANGQDPSNALLNHVGNTWTFQEYTKTQGRVTTKIYTVTWDGLNTPPAGVSTTTYSQGKTYYRKSDNTTQRLLGLPDKYTWATWFLINGITPNDQWPPIPSKNTFWAFTPSWPEYDLTL